MSFAIRNLHTANPGADRKSVELSLQQLSDQVRWLDQKLMMKVENEISDQFQDRMNEMNALKTTLKRVEGNY
ncbi:MAG: hypothetical protein ACQEWU_15445 [Bacillota bacterium]|uniref:Uncharacterized protein n=1 Tax=Virgibacillus salarius TaxID=447199 RepID=A0A941DS02_9BACI|nr:MULTISPECIES: hypothetical protein [Bacillaceae]MBR7795590.1 hypothetical protein [Virgibacillus salarius]MCC2251264.1 hypothetical protein [Virgibacillus sp. AGTR]NAZ08302.1 hypothetical protein [Agaribacter marinus]QRZ17051.1 hypothetical protein JUJ52_14795 [Virgibacillus sp. AGTR]